ncbi:FAD binding domain-containing protein [Aestuariispira insulae]|uniref:Carbon-monoxide dehydrogenase medium subunit n=1 Tax=Aestuariispira insulae TaxID=1461337 RepID=A0A3D9HN97_9PROT|nr:xanthine dehydrogenase family protein subunit M [Aestuariispira insulae]RED50973.1 carbon-monoxide dehydrogenase medium subunit [Aestuariispira insulae]
MYEFNYHKASSVSDAEQALRNASDGKIVAGGQTLLPTLKQRLASPSDLIDLGGCSELCGISVDGDTVTIGAMTTHAMVANSAEVQSAIPALAGLASNIGDAQVRNLGTIGGSIANNDPAADYPAACLGLGAVIVTDKREIVADDFFTGLFETALDEHEIITAIRFPKPEKACYQKFPNPASRYALVGVMVAKMSSGVRVAVTGAGADGVFRVDAFESALDGSFSASSLDIEMVHLPDLLEDIHGSPGYRENLIRVMGKRAVEACG